MPNLLPAQSWPEPESLVRQGRCSPLTSSKSSLIVARFAAASIAGPAFTDHTSGTSTSVAGGAEQTQCALAGASALRRLRLWNARYT
jgi:hypothetical protein